MLRRGFVVTRYAIVALPVSLWVSWAAWRGPPPPVPYPSPTPLLRTESPAAKTAVIAMASDITLLIRTASGQRGDAIQTHQLEATDAAGEPFLPHPIPDNPLMPGIASIEERCPADTVLTQADWVYCPATGVLRAVIKGQSTSGNE